MKRIVPLLVLATGCGGGDSDVRVSEVATTGTVSIQADVWADNWFAFYLGDRLILEDATPITTERSFNAESFRFKADYPMQLNLVLMDFREDDTGLEYIGRGNQQMGDGGFIAQFVDSTTGRLLAASNSQWKCLVTHEAPTDPACEEEAQPVPGSEPCGFRRVEEPAGWRDGTFDDSSWPNALEYTPARVRPKGGYDQIDWHESANLIWSEDLHRHNTLLCRVTVSG